MRRAEPRARAWLRDFKSFARKGNVAEFAVAVAIGRAFAKIGVALVGELVMPLVERAPKRRNPGTFRRPGSCVPRSG